MNLTRNHNGDVWVSLSRRNLLTLLKMLDHNAGLCTLHRSLGNDMALHVQAEEDLPHYQSEAREDIVRGICGIGPEDVLERVGNSKQAAA